MQGVHYLVPCVSKQHTIAVLALGPQGARRAAEQRGHGAGGGGGRAGGDRARERAPLPAAAGAGRRGRAHAAVQREHPRVARQRPGRRRRARPRRAVEPGARAAVRHHARGGRRAAARGAVQRARWSTRCATRAAPAPPAPRSTACRSRPRAAAPTRACWSTSRVVPLQGPPGRRAGRGVDPRVRGHHGAGPPRGAAADFRQDGVDRPARRRRGARGEHAAHGHLELHPDAARAGRSRRTRARSCSRRSSGRRSARRRSSTAC